MPPGGKSSYTDKQKHQAAQIEAGDEKKRCRPENGGKKSGAGRNHS